MNQTQLSTPVQKNQLLPLTPEPEDIDADIEA